MYEYFRGPLVQSTPAKAVIDVNGIGYVIQISLKTSQKLPPIGTQTLIYVAPVIREDEHILYGFLTIEEKNLFYLLTSVSGVGPKTAVGILGYVDIDDFQMAVLQGNVPLLSKVPSVGKKTAERLIVELKDKFQNIYRQDTRTSPKDGSLVSDAISALINLGYQPLEAQKRVNSTIQQNSSTLTLSEVISLSLQKS